MKKDPIIEQKIEELLAKMTLREKIGQLNQTMIPKEMDEASLTELRKGEVGSYILASSALAGNGEKRLDCVEFFNDLQKVAVNESRLGIPVIIGRDVIHGHRTVLPIPLALAAAFDDELVKKCYREIGTEAAVEGVHWSFSPMLDVSRDPRWGRCIESPGEDPYVGMQVAKAVVEGFQGDDLENDDCIAACAKHYIGYGASEGGRDYNSTDISDYTLRNYYLKAFKSAVDSGCQTIMNSFNEISGQPVASSRYLLYDLLKEELGFDGFVISDWEAIMQLKNQGVSENDKESAKLAINAGLDMDMRDRCYINYLEELVKEGKVKEETIDDSVRRVLRVKFRLGLFEKPYSPKYTYDRALHEQHARELAAASMVLLKNENKALPLSADKKIGLVGPMVREKTSMKGSWCLDGSDEDVVTVLEGMKNTGAVIRTVENQLYEDQLKAVGGMDVLVLCLGESAKVTGEAHSLADINVPPYQIELARRAKAMGKTVVAVMFFGRPVCMTELEGYCDAILYAWHPGTQAGNAVADILFGKVNPSGRVPMTMPRAVGQIPIYYNQPSSGRKSANGYFKHTGYANYDDLNSTPLYPFGFGLSYTEFAYNNVKAKETEISLEDLKAGKKLVFEVELENKGEFDGNEIVQLYITDVKSSMTRPLRELKGYKKVFVKAGETVKVELQLGFDELGFYNGNSEFVVEKGKFEIAIGKDCYTPTDMVVEVI